MTHQNGGLAHRAMLLGATVFGTLMAASGALAQTAPPLRPDQLRFRELYRELVETNTTLSVGSCTQAAQQIAARLRTAGYADSQITLFATPDHPKEGGVVAVLPGTSATARPILLLAHLDVVEAKRADWTRDPFTLVEENGDFYAAAPTTTRRWRPCGPTPWCASGRAATGPSARSRWR